MILEHENYLKMNITSESYFRHVLLQISIETGIYG